MVDPLSYFSFQPASLNNTFPSFLPLPPIHCPSIHPFICTYIHIYVHACIHTHTYIHTHILHTFIYIYTHIHAYTHTLTYLLIYIHTQQQQKLGTFNAGYVAYLVDTNILSTGQSVLHQWSNHCLLV